MSRSDRREETRRRLLAVARDLFESRGFEATHLRDVAGAAGVASGTIFVHFADKHDLLHAALFEDLDETIDRALASGPDAIEPWLDHVTGTLLAYYALRPELSRVLLQQSLVAALPWAERFAAQVGRVHAAVAARFEAAAARGEVAGDAALFGVAFVSFYTFALLAFVQGSHPDPRALVARLVGAHLAGARP